MSTLNLNNARENKAPRTISDDSTSETTVVEMNETTGKESAITEIVGIEEIEDPDPRITAEKTTVDGTEDSDHNQETPLWKGSS